ncbi:hypothetical protein SAMN05518672_104632 [Chitinophaga sp. CF118]|uniref:cytochrome c n=1 Tax=Chitinophaga sp. CF118 TaxID=1884367 RepID=UPI0008DF0981|nr:cytochrome c [Chitinophaga sp. CF118]SFE14086.1 hypothetical protein SAMN05518672_104632 [Chitinophaga sp. CF118]
MKCVTLSVFLVLFFHIADAQRITWYQHIAPIIHNHCTPCHHDGDAAPFQLNTYEDVAKRAAFIKKVTQNRYMPPWKPDPHYVSFINERKLTDEQITMIADWADHNMPKGKPVAGKDDTSFISGTHYGRKPDLVLTMKKAFVVKGNNTERFIVYKIPFELPDSMNVEAIEFTSTNKRIIHHANYEIDDVPANLDLYNTLDYINLTEGSRLDYEQYVPYRKKMIYYGGWIPGTSYESYPKDIGWIMPKRGVILLTLHYAPVGKDEENVSGIQLFFTKTPVKRQIQAVSIGSGGVGEKDIDPYFYIPANVVKSFKLKVTAPEDQSFLYVWPHMHYLGKSFKAYGITPANDTIRFVSIPDWDFKWQEPYWFPKLQKIPKGTVLTVEATYDNTVNNPSNPYNPPRLTYSSGDMKTTDEMLTLVMIFLPYEKGDENIKMKE